MISEENLGYVGHAMISEENLGYVSHSMISEENLGYVSHSIVTEYNQVMQPLQNTTSRINKWMMTEDNLG